MIRREQAPSSPGPDAAGRDEPAADGSVAASRPEPGTDDALTTPAPDLTGDPASTRRRLHGPAAPHASRPAALRDFDLAAVPTAAIQAELDRRQAQAHELLAEKARLLSRVAQLDREIARLSEGEQTLTRQAPLPSARRPELSDLGLPEALARVYAIGDEFSPAEAEQRLEQAGYSARASNLRVAVTQVLSRERRFKRLARGLYLRTG